MLKRRIHPAWFAVIVTFLTLVATAGFRSAPSVLVIPLEESFGWSRDNISLAIAINVLLFGLTAPFAAALMERFGIRRVVMTALTTVGIGAYSTIFMTKPWHLIGLWGVVVGVGTGSMALVFAATIVNRWFVKRRGLVIGALTAASATGQLIFLPGLSALATNIGWKSVSITVACGAFVMVPLIFIFLKERPSTVGVTPYGAPDGWKEPPLIKTNAGRLAIQTLKDASKVRDFWYLIGSFFVCGLSTSGLIGTHFIPAAHDHGMGEVTAASLLALVGVFDVVGTIFSGWLTDRYDPRKLLFVYYFFRGLSLFLLPSILFATVHPSTLVFVIFYGLDWVATVPPTVLLCRQVLGPDRATVVYGWVFAAHQIGGSVAALGAAILHTKFGDYATAFYISGLMCIITSYFVLRIGKVKEDANG
ncbi:MAG: MFS transporter [Actinomycetales bacterium]|nr:MAG: MFS transporter [Actinomycetales bacterium]